jgi:hypothetical protein
MMPSTAAPTVAMIVALPVAPLAPPAPSVRAWLRRSLPAAAALLAAACGLRGPVASRVTIAPGLEKKLMSITVETDIDAHTAGPAMDARVAELRETLLAGRDEWSSRFAAVPKESERRVVEHKYGLLRHVEHTALIDPDDLQRFFADSGMTLTLTHLGYQHELAIYPGASTRANRQQRERVEKMLAAWSEDAARYFNAVDRLYFFMSQNPQRAEGIFDMLLGDRQQPLNEQEQALVDTVTDAMDRLTARLQADEKEATTIDEEFDLVFNPFPAEIAVHTPQDVISFENFEKRATDLVVIHRDGLLDAMSALEGRWISPDPLAILLRSGPSEESKLPSPAIVAAMPRRSTPQVTATDVAQAVTEQLRPATVYRVRW